MNDVQANGDPKKIILTKPVENSTVTNQPASNLELKSLKSSTADHVRIHPRRHVSTVDKNSEEHLTNHKKQRYWNSWEELYLVELWRRYKDEVTAMNVPIPVYRKMMIAMRNRNMIVTAQDCRRKINNINTRYKQELSRMESSGCKPEWRLFSLVHCVLQPKVKEYDPWKEYITIKKLLDKIPKPIEVPAPVSNHINNNNYQTPQPQNIPTHSNISPYQPRNSYQTYLIAANLPLSSVSTAAGSPSSNRLSSSKGRFEKISILPFRNVTKEKIEHLRMDNIRLAEQRDADLKRLHMEQQNFRCFEEFIRNWTENKEKELLRIQQMSAQSVTSIENEENLNAEHQLQESIASAK